MPSPTDFAWAAGIIDGEGCITLNRDGKSFSLRVNVVNTDKKMLDRLHAMFGGSVGKMKQYKPQHRARGQWDAKCGKAEDVLAAVFPYLVSKKDQARMALASRAFRNPTGRNNNPHITTLAEMHTRLQVLKRVS